MKDYKVQYLFTLMNTVDDKNHGYLLGLNWIRTNCHKHLVERKHVIVKIQLRSVIFFTTEIHKPLRD